MKFIFLFLFLLLSQVAMAVDSVNPTGVNVNSTGVTTVFLTFSGTAGQESTEAFWCGEITVPANTVTSTNPCVRGTLFGFLPKSLDKTQPRLQDGPQTDSGSGQTQSSSLIDIMTIPASVSRRALQSALSGDNSSFFYVRKFESAGSTQYIAVTCRMAGNGARVPFALTKVQPYFDYEGKVVGVHLLEQGGQLPDIKLAIQYNGSGRLKARWEIVKPGDPLPEPSDLLPEAALPVAQRGTQKRYSVIDNVDVFLPPTGTILIDGPRKERLPNKVIGPYQILLRVEATQDKEGNSETASGAVVFSGGVAGFSLPPLRYYVASEDEVSAALRTAGVEKSLQLLPEKFGDAGDLLLNWMDISDVAYYSVEIQIEGEDLFKAIHRNGLSDYSPPPWITEKIIAQQRAVWRVSAFNIHGKRVARSDWTSFTRVPTH